MSGAKRKPVTMADIARTLNISKNAVSLALSGKPGVSDALRKQVLETAAQMRYGEIPSLADGRQPCIVVIVPEYIRDDSYFYSDVFWSIEHEARRIGYPTLTAGVSQRAEAEEALPITPENVLVLGFLVIGIIRESYLRALSRLQKPIVTVDIQHNDVPVSSVGSDNLRGGYLATQHLLDNGHRRIGFAGPLYTAQSVYERWCGYHQALLRAGITENRSQVIFGASDRFQLLDTTEALSPYLDRVTDMPSAWFCAGDLIAVSMVKLLSQRRLRVPEDVSVIGYDDLKVASMVTPALTTVRVDRKLMGKMAVWHLVDQTNGGRPSANTHIALKCTLVARDSVRPIGE